MENMPAHPTVFITPEGQNYKPPKNWKSLVLIIVGILIIGGLSFGGFYYRSFIQKNFQAISASLGIDRLFTSLTKKQPSTIGTNKDSLLFYADLEYNPKSGTTVQLKTGKISGSAPDYFPSLSSTPASDFAYRISVMSAKKNLLQNGWVPMMGNSYKTPKNTYKFRVTTAYEKDAIVRIYSKDYKLIWTTKII